MICVFWCLAPSGSVTVREVKKLAGAKARHTGEDESTKVSRLFQKLSVALMRGNAALFNNRVPYTAVHWW